MTLRCSDRRQSERWSHADDHGIVTVRIRSGHPAVIVNISAGGALVETASRLLPGASVDLHIETVQQRTVWRGRILRCTIVTLRAASVFYRAAIAFDRPLSWFAGGRSNGYAVPVEEPELRRFVRVDSTRNGV